MTGNYFEREILPGQAERDAAMGRNAFYVYVLRTDGGHYIGHTWHVGRRVHQHKSGEVPSTIGLHPRLDWVSKAMTTRADAIDYEAVLKRLNQNGHARFTELTGLRAMPWITYKTPVVNERPEIVGGMVPYVDDGNAADRLPYHDAARQIEQVPIAPEIRVAVEAGQERQRRRGFGAWWWERGLWVSLGFLAGLLTLTGAQLLAMSLGALP